MDEDEVKLPEDTLAILNEFLRAKELREREETENVQIKVGKAATFEEDWQLSQFWYNDETKNILGKVVLKLVTVAHNKYSKIALLSCPSLYAIVKELHDNVKIFEFDSRFAAFGDDFVQYDFNNIDAQEDYLSAHYENFDIIIADPPFLSEECITKMSKIIKKLARSSATRIIFCSGEVVAPWLKQHLQLTQCVFRPQHERNLGNEFACYANFELDELIE